MHASSFRPALALVALAAAAAVHADVFGVDFDVTANGDLVKTNWTNGAPSASNAAIATSRLATSTGVLNAVYLQLDWTGKNNGDFKNLSNTTTHFSGNYTLDFKVQNGNAVLDSFNAMTRHFEGNTAATGHAGDAATISDLLTSGTRYLTITDPAVLNALFVGSGNIGLKVRATGSGTMTAPGNNDYTINTYAGMKGHLMYDYTPQAVPEPASMAALGFGALGVLRRRKAAKAGAR